MKKINGRVHWELIRNDQRSYDYCMKEETRIDGPWEYGERPIRRNNATDWAQVKDAAKRGKLDEVPDDIYVKHYSNL